MKKTGIGLIVLLIAATTMISSCKKYQYGPALSIHSPKTRLVNSWTLTQAIDSTGTDITSNFTSFELILSKAGGAQMNIEFTVLGVPFNMSTVGTWTLQNKDMDIRFDYDQNIYDGTSTILKLKKDELWLMNEDGSEVHFVPKV